MFTKIVQMHLYSVSKCDWLLSDGLYSFGQLWQNWHSVQSFRSGTNSFMWAAIAIWHNKWGLKSIPTLENEQFSSVRKKKNTKLDGSFILVNKPTLKTQ